MKHIQSTFRTIVIAVAGLVLLSGGMTSCGLTKDIEVELPEFKSQLVVECYLEPNQPIEVSLSETQDYFGTLSLPFLGPGADVTVSDGTKTVKLEYNPFINFVRYNNYRANDTLPMVVGRTYYLTASDGKGRSVTATTVYQKPVEIDSVGVEENPNKDTTFLFTAFFNDPPGENFYRFRIRKLPDTVIVDYVVDAGIFDGQRSTFGGPYVKMNDSEEVELTLYTMDRQFYDFTSTVQRSNQSNGNPFGQPTTIQSNIVGGLGVFTTLSYSRIVRRR